MNMKNLDKTRWFFNHIIWIVVFITSTIQIGICQNSRTKVFETSFDGHASTNLYIAHKRGDLYVKRSIDNKIHVKLEVKVSGEDESEFERLFEVIDLKEEVSGNNIQLDSKVGIINWQDILGRKRIRLKNGVVLRKLKKLELTIWIQIPSINSLHLQNKYHNIELEPISADVTVNLYSGELNGNDIEGDLNLNLKYSKARLGSFQDGDFDLYESKIYTGSGLNLKVDSKYSHLESKSLAGLDMESYEDDVSFGDIPGIVKISSKYSDFIMGDAKDLELNLYETDINMKKARSMNIDSKYSKIEMTEVEKIEVLKSYEDKIIGTQVSDFIAMDSKYGKFSFNQLSGICKLGAYETSLEIDVVAPSFTELWVDSKYDHVSFPIPTSVSYTMDVEMKYGKIEYSKNSFSQINHTTKNDQIMIKSKPQGVAKAKVYIRSYETDFALKNE